MTIISKLIADGDGVKGRRFVLDLIRPTLIIGPNGSGKSARLLACHLALGTRIGGSAVPGSLGDTADDCGRVELAVEGETSDGRPLRLTRILGAKHEARLSVGDEPLVKDIKGVEAALVAHLGAQRMQPTDLGDFVSLTTEKQAALVARVAGVTLADPAIRADLDDRLRRTEVEYDDARGMPRKGAPDREQLVAVDAALDEGGLEAAKEAARVQKNEWQRRRQEAEKARGRLVDLRRDDLPPGTLADAQGRERAAGEQLAQVREKLAARAQAQAERQRAAARVETARQRAEQARARLESMPASPAADDGARADLDALQRSLDEARAAAQRAEEAARADARNADDIGAKLREVGAELARIDHTIVALAAGRCPTCGCEGGALDQARDALQETRAALVRRQAVIGVRLRAADQAAAKTSDTRVATTDLVRQTERTLREVQDAATRAGAAGRQRAEADAALGATRAELAAAEQALAALPALEGAGDLEADRARLEAERAASADAVAQLAGYEEAERLRAQNEQDLDTAILARATWGALEKTLGAFGAQVARRAATKVIEHADCIVTAVYPASGPGWGRVFVFRPLPERDDEPPAWGFGFATLDSGGMGADDDFRPYSALSDSEQIVCGVALTYAMQQLGARPFRPVVLDGLEALETDRSIRLVRVLADEMKAGRLSAVLCAMRVDVGYDAAGGAWPRDDWHHKLAGSGIAVVQAHRDSLRTPAVTVCDQASAAAPPATVVDEAGAVVPDPPEAAPQTPAAGGGYVFCRDRECMVAVVVHDASGCTCGAEVGKPTPAETKKRRVRAVLAAQAETPATAGEGTAA